MLGPSFRWIIDLSLLKDDNEDSLLRIARNLWDGKDNALFTRGDRRWPLKTYLQVNINTK